MKLTFVYNANSGKINTWLDIGHKLISPKTYSCDLCSLTHGLFTEREEWKRYQEGSSIELEFLHKDEFEKSYGKDKNLNYPVILKSESDGEFELLFDAQAIHSFKTVDALLETLPK